MKLYSIIFFKRLTATAASNPADASSASNSIILSSAIDVSSFGYFQRSSAREFIIFLSRTVAGRVALGAKTQVTENGHVVYAMGGTPGSTDGLVAVAIADMEYNSRVAFSMLSDLMPAYTQAFRQKYTNPNFIQQQMRDNSSNTNVLPWPHLDETLAKYQKPEEVDKILRIHKDIEETKVIIYNALDQVLERGQKIDDLVQQSEDLGVASKAFYSSAKETNAGCCIVM